MGGWWVGGGWVVGGEWVEGKKTHTDAARRGFGCGRVRGKGVGASGWLRGGEGAIAAVKRELQACKSCGVCARGSITQRTCGLPFT